MTGILQASDLGLLAIFAISLGLQSPQEHLGLLCLPPEVDVDEVVGPAGAAVLGRPAHDEPAGGGHLGPSLGPRLQGEGAELEGEVLRTVVEFITRCSQGLQSRMELGFYFLFSCF